MKRKASPAFDDGEDEAGQLRRAPPQLGDYLIAEEILPRLPVRAAAACAVAGALRGILTGPDYWRVRNRRLPRPHAACLVVHRSGGAGFRHEFHYADAASSPAEPAVVVRAAAGGNGTPLAAAAAAHCHGGTPFFRELRLRAINERFPVYATMVRTAEGKLLSYPYDGARLHNYADASFSKKLPGGGGKLAPFRLAGTCNGLVLLTAPWDNTGDARAVLFNPATGAEETLVLDLAPSGSGGGGNGKDDVFRCFCGLGYSPSSKTYKALVCARDFSDGNCAGELVVVPLGVGGGDAGHEKPRTVAKLAKLSGRCADYFSSLTLDGKVYVLPDVTATAMVAFDVDGGTAAHVTLPPRPPCPCSVDTGYVSELMELWARPCVAIGNRDASELWALTPELRWERRCTLAVVPGPRRWSTGYVNWDDAAVHGAWDCGGGRLFVLFRDGRGFVYEYDCLRERKTTTTPGSLPDTHEPRLPEEAARWAPMAELPKVKFCWGYQPTIVPPAAVFGGDVCPEKRDGGLRHFSSGGRSWVDESATRRCLEDLMEMMRERTHDTARGLIIWRNEL